MVVAGAVDDVGEDIVHAGVRTAAVGHDRPPEDGDDAVSEFVDLLDVRGEEDDDHSGLRELLELAVDLGPGADVDASRRLVQEQHARVERHRLGDGNLLLVAAAEVRDLARQPLGVDGEEAGEMPRPLARLAELQEPEPRDAVEHRGGDVCLDRGVEEDALSGAVLGHVGDAVADRLGGAPGLDIDAVDLDGADIAPTQARERLDDDVGAGAELPHDRDDLALADLQVERSEAAGHGEALEPDARRTLHLFGVVGDLLAGGDLAADHRANELRRS